MAVRTVEAPPPSPPTTRRLGLVLTSLVLALIPLQLDSLVAATAAPTIAGDLGGFAGLAWIATTYLLTMAVGTVLSGRLGDMVGRKLVLLVALVIFLAGSLGAGLSPTMGWLITARALQGIGAGMTFTTLLAVIADIAPPERRARYQGLFGAVAPFSMIVGPWVGGVITDQLGWRWIFLLNLPLIAVSIVGVLAWLKVPAGHGRGRIDLAGLLALSAAATGTVLTMTWGGHQYGWGSWQVLTAAAAAAVAIVVLISVERRATHPVLPPALFADRAVLMSLVIMFLGTGAVMMGAMNYLPVFLQLVQGRSASNSGLLLLPMLLPAIGVAMVTGGWTTTARRFRPALIAGTALLAASCGLLATMTSGTAGWLTAGYMVLAGLGIGLLFQTPVVLVQNSAKAEEVGAATGVAMFLRTMGGSIGVGALGALFTTTVADSVRARSGTAVDTPDVSALTPGQVHQLPAAVQQVVAEAVASGSSVLFWVATAAAAVALLAAVGVPRMVQRRG